MKIITMTLLKLDKNQQKERENVNTTDLALEEEGKKFLIYYMYTAFQNICLLF